MHEMDKALSKRNSFPNEDEDEDEDEAEVMMAVFSKPITMLKVPDS